MKYFICLVFVSILVLSQPKSSNSFYVASWNMENLFDNINDKNKSDEEFTKNGRKEWDAERVQEKLHNLAFVIRKMNGNNGPDVLGCMEVEHKYLLDSLFQTYFPERNYRVVGYESPDIRGIDTYLVYDSNKFELIDTDKIEVNFYGGDYKTRDILHAELIFKNYPIHFFVNHWPSRRGGEEASEPRRINAASTLMRFIDSIAVESDSLNIIIMGDFNDEPSNYSLVKIVKAKLINSNSSMINLAWPLSKKGIGTHFYDKEFNMLDQIIISSALIDNKAIEYKDNSFAIFQDESFIYNKGKMKGAIIPSFHDGKYLKGYSDHLPVVAEFYLREE